jgi:hypothetical protein
MSCLVMVCTLLFVSAAHCDHRQGTAMVEVRDPNLVASKKECERFMRDLNAGLQDTPLRATRHEFVRDDHRPMQEITITPVEALRK